MPSPTRLVFIGDSITDCGRDRDDAASLGDGYVSLIAADRPEATVVNLGVSGDRAVEVAARWNAQVPAAAPDLLTMYIGVNDMWRRYDRDDATSAEAFEATYRDLLARVPELVAAGNVILMEPFLTPVNAEQERWITEDLDAKREVVARLAAEHGLRLVPLHAVMTDLAAELGAEQVAGDGVHPSPAGHRALADAWLAAAAV